MIVLRPADFPIRPEQHVAESFHGYAGRLLASNGFDCNNAALGRSLHREWLGALPEIQKAQIDGPRRYHGSLRTEVKKPRFYDRFYKYCHHCVTQLGYQLRTVDFVPSLACPVHHVRLRRTCPHCDARVHALGVAKGRCDCGRSLGSETNAHRLCPNFAAWEMKCLRLLIPQLQTDTRPWSSHTQPAWLYEATFEQLDALLHQLTRLLGQSAEMPSYDRARGALGNWPASFHTFLRDALSKRADHRSPILDKQQLYSIAPGLQHIAESDLMPPEVRRQASNFFEAHTLVSITVIADQEQFLVNPANAQAKLFARTFSTSASLAQALGYTESTTKALLRILEVPVVQPSPRRLLVDSDDANCVIERFRDLVPLTEAASAFALGYRALPHLFRRLGLGGTVVRVKPKEGVSKSSLDFMIRTELDAFRKCVVSCCRTDARAATGSGPQIGNADAFTDSHGRSELESYLPPSGTGKTTTARIYLAILEGRLDATCVEPFTGWCDLRVNITAAHDALSEPRTSPERP